MKLPEEAKVEEKLSRLMSELRRRGYRITAQRLTIARIVFENIKEHPSFMQILEAVRRKMPSISPSTVYNNLQLLEQLGFIKSFDVAGETRYDDSLFHINVVCMDTGRIFDLENDERLGSELAALLEEAYGAKATEIIVYAYCGSRAKSGGEGSGPG